MTEAAMFRHDPETGLYWPANKKATAEAAILTKMRLTVGDLLCIKSKGTRLIHQNGQDIQLSVTA